jgi:hypothetical protein
MNAVQQTVYTKDDIIVNQTKTNLFDDILYISIHIR